MGFWGIEVKPGISTPYHADNVQGKLRVTQATLGIGSSAEKSILQCSSGHKSPVFLCSLLPNKIESCPLNLEFDDDDLVAFSVVGPRSIHLSGYFVTVDGDDYEYDSFDEDAEGSETEESSEHDSEDGYDFIDDSDADMYPSSHIPNSGVVIEEIVDDDKPESGDDPTKQLKKKKQVAHLKEDKSSHLPIVVRGETVPPNLENEDDAEETEDKDGFPISVAEKGKSESPKEETEIKEEQARRKTEKANKRAKQVDHSASLKRKVENAEEDEQQQDGKKKKKRKDKLKEHGKGESSHASDNINETNETTPDEKHPEEVKTTVDVNDVSHAKDGQPLSNNEVLVEKKSKKKNKKKTTKESEEATTPNQIANTVENKDLSISEKSGKKQTEDKPSQVRSFANGLVIEELSLGKPDGKSATPGKKVSVKYIGKLKKNGKIFDSNVGRAPFKFRLGLGQVIKGWEVGVNGMRIGDKRRITVPPSMGYGDKRAGSIPPNSWLVFDVELVNVGG